MCVCVYVYIENVELKNNELTQKGFLDLNQMEAEDNQGDTGDLWVTLQCMGYNKALKMDQVNIKLICYLCTLLFSKKN